MHLVSEQEISELPKNAAFTRSDKAAAVRHHSQDRLLDIVVGGITLHHLDLRGETFHDFTTRTIVCKNIVNKKRRLNHRHRVSPELADLTPKLIHATDTDLVRGQRRAD